MTRPNNGLELFVICRSIVEAGKAGPLTIGLLEEAMGRYSRARAEDAEFQATLERIAKAMKETEQ